MALSTQMFDSYGARASSDNSADPYSGFGGRSGQSYDAETGLHFDGGQYYDTGAGRYVGRGGGANPGASAYSYAGNNPVGGGAGGSARSLNGRLPDPFDDRPCADAQYGAMILGHGAGLQQAEQFLGSMMPLVPGVNVVYGVGQAISGCNFADRPRGNPLECDTLDSSRGWTGTG